jgi:hypothetical protein
MTSGLPHRAEGLYLFYSRGSVKMGGLEQAAASFTKIETK